MLNSINSYNLNTSKFDFKFTTSSGDKIELSLYDDVEIDKSYLKKGNVTTTEMTLKHEYGYHFHYEGNGLSKEDIKEIQEAMKKVKPLLEKFLKAKKLHEKEITNFAQNLKSLLPQPKNENHENAIKSHAVNTFDDILKDMEISIKELKKTKELFDKLFSKRFEYIV